MFSERVRSWLADVRSNIEDINRYIGETDEAGFACDKLLRDAVERCLERISGAVARIDRSGCNLEGLEPEIP